MASEFQMAYLPSSVLSGSSAAMQLSSGSKTDRHSQTSFFSKLLLLCDLVKCKVKYHVSMKCVLLVDGPGFAEG